jgi:hypothetical protein
MDQANEIEVIRHGRQLATNCVRGQEEFAIEHGIENAAEAPHAYNGFSANGNTPLSLCLPLGVHPSISSFSFSPCYFDKGKFGGELAHGKRVFLVPTILALLISAGASL